MIENHRNGLPETVSKHPKWSDNVGAADRRRSPHSGEMFPLSPSMGLTNALNNAKWTYVKVFFKKSKRYSYLHFSFSSKSLGKI